MVNSVRPIIWLLVVSSFILHPSSFLMADGGVVQLRKRAGDYQITVFTSPTPLRAGPVDVSVLVQDAATGECMPEAQVTVRLKVSGAERMLECPATTEVATNKLLRAAEFQLPEPGCWDVSVAVEGPHGPAVVQFGIQADEPPPRWLELWPWFSWPAFAVALFGTYQVLVRRKVPSVRKSADSVHSRNWC
jgi:hypothetical protein